MDEKERLKKQLQYLSSFDKLTGEPGAHLAAEYLLRSLKEYGVSCHTETFAAYLSNPVSSRLLIDGEEISSRPRSFSESTGQIRHAPVIYDRGTCEGESLIERRKFLKTVSGKLVLGFGYDERYAKLLEQYGAAGWVQIWTSNETVIHEDTVSPVWGTPDMDTFLFQLKLPVLAISRPEGERLIRKWEKMQETGSILYADFETKLDTEIKKAELPVADIQGKTNDFVLLSCHYDTWYQGAFDNCAANALALEIARNWNKKTEQMQHSLRIAWWPGHSNGRYMGSTWYCDHHWDELYSHCIAHINLDLLGSKGADHTLVIRTAGLEGTKWLKKQTELADHEADLQIGRIGRGADQSFWGAEIPYHINPRYEAAKEHKISDAPGPGVYWWHTIEDTYDKIDLDGLLRDGNVVQSLLHGLLTQELLPVDFADYYKVWNQYLEKLKRVKECQASIAEIQLLLKQIIEQCLELENRWTETPDQNIQDKYKADHNRLCRLTGGVLSRLMHSSGSAYEQDTSFSYGPLHLLSASAKTEKESSPDDWYLFRHTTFVRQRNRMVTELKKLLNQLEREFE